MRRAVRKTYKYTEHQLHNLKQYLNVSSLILILKVYILESVFTKIRVKWVPVTTAWRVLGLRMEERPPVMEGSANTLKKQSRRADKRWSSSLGVGRGANNSSPLESMMLRNIRTNLGRGPILWYGPSYGKQLRIGTGGGLL
jgi:hypothetical protein